MFRLSEIPKDPTTTTLCPTFSCLSVSHLSCLSIKFLAAESLAVGNKNRAMIPRGGECSQCHNYVLWGDIIRGCYRRAHGHAGTAPPEIEEDLDLSESAMLAVSPLKKSSRKGKRKAAGRATKQIAVGDIRTDSEPGEFFDLDTVSSETQSKEEVPSAAKRKPVRPQKSLSPPAGLSMEDVIASIQPSISPTNCSGAIPAPTPFASPAKLTMNDVLSKIALSSSPSKSKRLEVTPPRSNLKTLKMRMLHTKVAPTNDGEFFDLNAISAGSEHEDWVPPAPILNYAGTSRLAPEMPPTLPFVTHQQQAAVVREAKLTFFDDDTNVDPNRGNGDSSPDELDDPLGVEVSRAMSVLSVLSGPGSPGATIELSD